MIGIVLEQFRKIENSSRTLEHVFAGGGIRDRIGHLMEEVTKWDSLLNEANQGPVSWQAWHDKDPSLLEDHKR